MQAAMKGKKKLGEWGWERKDIMELTRSSLFTPITAKGTLAGFNIGPRILNIVLTLSFFLTGLTIFIAGW